MAHFRNLVWTMDFRNRLWSNHPTEMIVRTDYVILFWESIPGFSQGVKPTSLVVSQQCSSRGDGSKILNFSIFDKNTTRRGPRGNKHTVRRPKKLSSTSRVIKFAPDPLTDDSDGEFFYIPRGSLDLEPICGSGLFWHYFRWWITPVDNTIMNGYARYLPQLYGALFPNTIYGDHMLCNIDEHFECVDVCLIDPPDQYKLKFGFGDSVVARKVLPPIQSKLEADQTSITKLDHAALFPKIQDQIRSFYGDHTISVSPVVGTESKASLFITIVGNAEFTWYDVNGNETSDVNSICTYFYDHTPIFRVDAYNCLLDDECKGRSPGWYLEIGISYVINGDPGSITTTIRISDPLGIPGEDSELFRRVANYVLSIIMDKVNELLRTVISDISLLLPPNYRWIGRFLLIVIDVFDIRIIARVFFCPGPRVLPSTALPKCNTGDIPFILPPL